MTLSPESQARLSETFGDLYSQRPNQDNRPVWTYISATGVRDPDGWTFMVNGTPEKALRESLKSLADTARVLNSENLSAQEVMSLLQIVIQAIAEKNNPGVFQNVVMPVYAIDPNHPLWNEVEVQLVFRSGQWELQSFLTGSSPFHYGTVHLDHVNTRLGSPCHTYLETLSLLSYLIKESIGN